VQLARVEGDLRADVARHHERDRDVGRVHAQIDLQGFGETFDCKLCGTVGGMRQAGT
jgi:hypothetical protein